MSRLVEEILNKNYEMANDALSEQFRTILERKMCEMKKMVAAEMYSQTDEKLKSVSKLYRGVNEEENEKEDKEDSSLDEQARTSIIRARIRGGAVQRRQKVSNVPGMVIRGGKLQRMSAAERRRRKLGAMRAKLKTRSKQVQIQRNRKLSLMKRKRLGI